MREDKKAFLIERYKYILSQKRELNRNTLFLITRYQIGIALLITGQFGIFVELAKREISIDMARVASVGLLIGFSFLSVVALTLLGSGVAAWMNYKDDERLLELEFLGVDNIAQKWSDVLSWYETYIFLFVLALLISIVSIYVRLVFPIVGWR